jgi:predicted flap endonuclease-1-like 5' DNA nuclease
MRFKIIDLKGVGPHNAKALEKAGFYYAEELLNLDVHKISSETKINEKDLQRWKDNITIMKIRSIGPAYACLLHRDDVGILTINDLAKCNAKDLLDKIANSNKNKRLVKVLPTLNKVQRWIDTAKK